MKRGSLRMAAAVSCPERLSELLALAEPLSGWKCAIPAPRALFPKGQTRLIRSLSHSLQNRNAFSECSRTHSKEKSFFPLAFES